MFRICAIDRSVTLNEMTFDIDIRHGGSHCHILRQVRSRLGFGPVHTECDAQRFGYVHTQHSAAARKTSPNGGRIACRCSVAVRCVRNSGVLRCHCFHLLRLERMYTRMNGGTAVYSSLHAHMHRNQCKRTFRMHLKPWFHVKIKLF